MQQQSRLESAVIPMIAVYPEGSGIGRGLAQSWNAGICFRPATDLQTEDASLLRYMISTMKIKSLVDPLRIWVFGFSNGGLMGYRLVC
ncbi:MAG: hypothetical protein WCR08_08830 [Gammaproteobacteria bacterium]